MIPPDLQLIFDAELAAIPGYLESAFRLVDNPILSLAKRVPVADPERLIDYQTATLESPPICLDDWRNPTERDAQSARLRSILSETVLYTLSRRYVREIRRAMYVTSPEQLQIPNGAVLVDPPISDLGYVALHDRTPVNTMLRFPWEPELPVSPTPEAKFVDHIYLAEGWLTDTFPDDAPFGDWSLVELPREGGPDVTWCVFRGEFFSQCHVDFSKVARIRLPIQS